MYCLLNSNKQCPNKTTIELLLTQLKQTNKQCSNETTIECIVYSTETNKQTNNAQTKQQ